MPIRANDTAEIRRPPKSPKDKSQASLKKYLLEFSIWVLEGPVHVHSGPSSPKSSEGLCDQNDLKKRRTARSAENASAVWITACVDAAFQDVSNFSEAICLYNKRGFSPEHSKWIHKFAVPGDLCSAHPDPGELPILFAYGLHQLISAAMIRASDGQPFTLQALQDRLRVKRKVPIPIVQVAAEFYTKKGWWQAVEQGDAKHASWRKYNAVEAFPELSPRGLAELALLHTNA